MLHNKILFSLIFIHISNCLGSTFPKSRPSLLTMKNLPLSQNIKRSLSKSIYSEGVVVTKDLKYQSLKLKVAGLHPKACWVALSKISQYEHYKNYSGIITRSNYNDKTSMIDLDMDHLLMPFPMTLNFKIKRIEDPGNYPFTFKNGILKGLRGEIRVAEHKKQCLFYVKANWTGPKTKIPDKIFSFFTTVLGEKFMERLFQVSRTL